MFRFLIFENKAKIRLGSLGAHRKRRFAITGFREWPPAVGTIQANQEPLSEASRTKRVLAGCNRYLGASSHNQADTAFMLVFEGHHISVLYISRKYLLH